MFHLTTALDAASGVPLYEQLYESLAAEMRSGAIPAGNRMPGKRRLAAELSVSVNTVDAAYQILATEGYMEPRERSGFYVQEYLALPDVYKRQDYGTTNGVDRAGQLTADIAAWQARFGDTVTLWYGYSLAEVTGSSSQLGAPAAQLGVKNLLVKVPSSSTLDAAAREELTLSLTEAGVELSLIHISTAPSSSPIWWPSTKRPASAPCLPTAARSARVRVQAQASCTCAATAIRLPSTRWSTPLPSCPASCATEPRPPAPPRSHLRWMRRCWATTCTRCV